MADKQDSSQLLIAKALESAARDLALSTQAVPRPSDSYALLETLASAQAAIGQVYEQLATWHGQVLLGVHHAGHDKHGDPEDPIWVRAELALQEAARHSAAAVDAVKRAHAANGVALWFDEIRADES